MAPIRIATRGSPLALWQAEYVAAHIRAHVPGAEVALLPMRTQGDKMLGVPLAKVGGKGLFVKELEAALLDGRAELAVHSMKDVPMDLPPGLHIPVLMAREDPRDALVCGEHPSLLSLPAGARIGTSSLRRKCQLRALRPDLRVDDLRGNVNTRLARLDAGDFDALLLACAGLQRLGMHDRVREALAPELLLPAIGQGVMGIECRAGDARVESAVAGLHDREAAIVVGAERALNRRLGGGCQVPIAGHAVGDGDTVWLRALVASEDGARVLRAEGRAPAREAEALGERIAEQLLADGAGEILDAVYGEA